MDWLIDWLISWLVDCLFDWLIDWLVDCLIRLNLILCGNWRSCFGSFDKNWLTFIDLRWFFIFLQFWERSVTHFPTHPYFWMLYIEQEIKAGHAEEVDKLFSRCLHKIPSIELNRLHVRYVMQTHPNWAVSAQNREKVREAYDQALQRVGLDVEAGPLYLDYIRFLNDGEALGPYGDQQRSQKCREVYQKACATPLANIEHMWKEYCAFEGANERATQERSRDYMNAKKQSKILEPIVRSLRRDKLPSRPRTLDEERHQVWRLFDMLFDFSFFLFTFLYHQNFEDEKIVV